MQPEKMKSIAFWLLPVMILIWWRSHTFAPVIYQETGLKLWPVVAGRSEPLDCDESAYGYMGRRQAEGDVLYKYLTEYKPPVGYWFYAIAVAIGGADEMTIRLMMMPVVLANCLLVGLILSRLCSNSAAFIGMIFFILLSTDPFVFGNGSNLEHLMNLLMTISVAFYLIYKHNETRPGWLFMAGLFIGLAAMVKQVCLLALLPILVDQLHVSRISYKSVKICTVLISGFAIPILVVVMVLVYQGNVSEARADVLEYSRAMAAGTPVDAKAPFFLIRWMTGNSDPRNGRLPWPFGQTDWLVWWGAGSWPMLLISPFLIAILLRRRNAIAYGSGLIIVFYWLACWLMIILPGLYWQHYYMLLAPGSALIAGVAWFFFHQNNSGPLQIKQRFANLTGKAGLLIVLFVLGYIQTRDYLLVPAEQLTAKYKGGAQWISLRLLSEEIVARTNNFQEKPGLEVWGWQSPLLFYTGFDAPNRYFFTDPLMKAHFQKGHPLIKPRLAELMQSIREKRPGIVFCGDIPFDELNGFLQSDYLPSTLTPATPTGHGLYVRKDLYAAFHSAR
ncbi:MAG: ArnT family glycosyltransferase [bacterium]